MVYFGERAVFLQMRSNQKHLKRRAQHHLVTARRTPNRALGFGYGSVMIGGHVDHLIAPAIYVNQRVNVIKLGVIQDFRRLLYRLLKYPLLEIRIVNGLDGVVLTSL